MRKLKGILLCLTMLTWHALQAQNKEILGKIVDSKDNTPLGGVTVKAKNTTANTVSLADGSFRLAVPANVTTLVFSYVGYTDQEVAIGEGAIVVSLVQADKALSEVIVVGYGTKIKREVSASIAKVNGREFANLPLPSFETALQGRAAGVFINTGSGKLGQGMKIRVRGISSITASTQPFIVIDGVPMVQEALGSYTEPDNPLAMLNPDDIESI